MFAGMVTCRLELCTKMKWNLDYYGEGGYGLGFELVVKFAVVTF